MKQIRRAPKIRLRICWFGRRHKSHTWRYEPARRTRGLQQTATLQCVNVNKLKPTRQPALNCFTLSQTPRIKGPTVDAITLQLVCRCLGSWNVQIPRLHEGIKVTSSRTYCEHWNTSALWRLRIAAPHAVIWCKFNGRNNFRPSRTTAVSYTAEHTKTRPPDVWSQPAEVFYRNPASVALINDPIPPTSVNN